MHLRTISKLAAVGCLVVGISGCGGIRDHVRSKDFRDNSPAYRATGVPSPIANVPDMPGWTTDLDSAIAFATENPQKTVVFVQQNGSTQSESIKEILNSSQAETALTDKQKVTINTATAGDVAARFGVTQTPAVIILGPGGVPQSQKTGKISRADLLSYIK